MISSRPALAEPWKVGIRHDYGNTDSLDILVLGDSHGLMWAPAIDAVAKELGLSVLYMTADGTPVFFDPATLATDRQAQFFTPQQFAEFNASRLDVIAQHKPRLVVVGAAWANYAAEDAAPLLRFIQEQGSRVVLLGDPPIYQIGDKNAPQFMAFFGLKPDDHGQTWSNRIQHDSLAKGQDLTRELVEPCAPDCIAVPTADLYLDKTGRNLRIASHGYPNYIDDDHLSTAGAMLAKDRIRDALEEALIQKRSTPVGDKPMETH